MSSLALPVEISPSSGSRRPPGQARGTSPGYPDIGSLSCGYSLRKRDGAELKGSPVWGDARTRRSPAYSIQLHPARHPACAVTERVPDYISINWIHTSKRKYIRRHCPTLFELTA